MVNVSERLDTRVKSEGPLGSSSAALNIRSNWRVKWEGTYTSGLTGG